MVRQAFKASVDITQGEYTLQCRALLCLFVVLSLVAHAGRYYFMVFSTSGDSMAAVMSFAQFS